MKSLSLVSATASVTLYVIISPVLLIAEKLPSISSKSSAATVSAIVCSGMGFNAGLLVAVIVNVCVLESAVPSLAVTENVSVSLAPATMALMAVSSGTYL